MKVFKIAIAIALGLLGIALGVYVGVYLLFIGGIIGLINAFSIGLSISIPLITWSILKLMFAGVLGWTCSAACFLPAAAIIGTLKE